MNRRPRKLFGATALAIAALGAGVASADFLVYKNTFSTKAELLQMRHLVLPSGGTHCKRGLIRKKMRVTVGRSTVECDFSPPVVADSGSTGGNFNISATIVLSPLSKLKKKTFMSVGLRVHEAGGTSKYRLDVYPAAKRFALRKYQNGDKAVDVPASHVFAQGKRKVINDTGIANRIGLKVTTDATGGATVLAKINGKVVGSTVDAVGPLDGKLTEVTIGRAAGSAEGASGTFDTVSIQAS